MKNVFKLGFVAFALSLTVAACSSDKKALGTTDSTKVDSAAATSTTTTDTMKKDTAKTDTTKKP